jgi:hypothetical protein
MESFSIRHTLKMVPSTKMIGYPIKKDQGASWTLDKNLPCGAESKIHAHKKIIR